MAKKLPASNGYFNKEMRAILREGEKTKKPKSTKSAKGKKSSKK